MMIENPGDLEKVRMLIAKMNEDPEFRDVLLGPDLELKLNAIQEIGMDPEEIIQIRREMNTLMYELNKISIWVPT